MRTNAFRRVGLTLITPRCFASSAKTAAKNRIYPNRIRREEELETLNLMSASTRIPLVTLWTATWCQNCKIVLPLIQELIEKDRVGEREGGISFVEIEMDSPDLGGLAGLGMSYGITSMPTLLAFDRQEPQLETKVWRLDDLKNKKFLTEWIEREAARHGEGGAGGSFFGMFKR